MSLSVNEAWNTVALEERIELIPHAQANGILGAMIFVLLMGSIGWGFDQINVLWAGIIGSFFVMPLFTSRAWRKTKPKIILSYLAARSVARRYAYGFGIRELDIVLVFKGYLEEVFQNAEERAFAQKDETVDFESGRDNTKEVWICLLRGGIVAISERMGGAKLEFATFLDRDTKCSVQDPQGPGDSAAVTIVGSGKAKHREVVITSQYPGSLYVFHKQTGRLIYEAAELQKKIEQMAADQKKIANS